MSVRGLFVCAAMSLAITAATAPAGETLPGPVVVDDVLEVIDGDTLALRLRVWLGTRVETRVRIAGIDTPEMRGRCEAERRAARAARERLVALVDAGVVLRDIAYGKYAGRVVARVLLPDGRDVAALLIADGLGVPYGGGRRPDWCAGAGG